MNQVAIDKSHPPALYILFFTEMWERFSYYGMRGILLLFMVNAVETGGFGMDAATAAPWLSRMSAPRTQTARRCPRSSQGRLPTSSGSAWPAPPAQRWSVPATSSPSTRGCPG